MALNSTTRGDLRRKIARAFVGRRFRSGTVTSATATTTVDSTLTNDIYPDSYFKNRELSVISSAGVLRFTSNCTAYDKETGTFTHPSQSTPGQAGDTWEAHVRAASLKQDFDDVINEAIGFAVQGHFLADVESQEIAFQRGRFEYPLPSSTFHYVHRVDVDWRHNQQARSFPGNWDTLVGLKDVGGRTKVAQSFKLTDGSNPSVVLGDLYLLLARVGTPTGTWTITVEADSSGSPSGTALATATITQTQAQAHPLDPTYKRLTWDKRPVVVNDTTYWWVVTPSSAADADNYLAVCNDTGAQYGHGAPKVYDGSSWSSLTGDLIFTLRGTTPEWLMLDGGRSNAERDWEIGDDGGTKLLRMTKKGYEKLERCDGSPLRLYGQVAPDLVTADSDTVDLPQNYVISKCGLLLAQRNPDYWLIQPGGQVVANGWKQDVSEFEKRMRVQIKAGAWPVEPL